VQSPEPESSRRPFGYMFPLQPNAISN